MGPSALPGRRMGLATALRERTRALHVQAERSGFVGEMLRGRAGRVGYELFLRNLLPVYAAMEQGLERHRHVPALRSVAQPALYRTPALEHDLDGLCGAGWARSRPLLPAGEAYAARIEAAATGDGACLIAHAYARYLGDLSGGQILMRLLGRSLGLGPSTLAFYAFPAIADLEAFKAAYRDALDRAGLEIADPGAVIEEAAMAFRLNIELSLAVQAAVGPCRGAHSCELAGV